MFTLKNSINFEKKLYSFLKYGNKARAQNNSQQNKIFKKKNAAFILIKHLKITQFSFKLNYIMKVNLFLAVESAFQTIKERKFVLYIFILPFRESENSVVISSIFQRPCVFLE